MSIVPLQQSDQPADTIERLVAAHRPGHGLQFERLGWR